MIPESVTCGGWIRTAASRLDPTLVPPPALRRAIAVADHLPGTVLAALEARLASPMAAVDLSIRIQTAEQALLAARRLAAASRIPPHVARFVERWAQDSSLRSALSELWLEFDLGADSAPIATATELPTPTLCGRLASGLTEKQLLDEILPGLHGEPLTAEQRRSCRECLRHLPPSVRPFYAFSMLSRQQNDVRLELLGGLEPIGAAVERFAPASRAIVSSLAPLFAGVERTQVALDIGPEGVRPRVGVEGSFRRLPGSEPGWRELFRRLEAAGLSSAGSIRACGEWTGSDTPRSAPDWPDGAPRAGVFLARALSHVKVVAEAGKAAEAKAYLFVAPVRSRRRPAGETGGEA